jgi:hypothetical protein
LLRCPIIESVITTLELWREADIKCHRNDSVKIVKVGHTMVLWCGKQGGTAKYIPRPYMGTGYFYFPCEYFYYLGGIDHD